jgi:hypothetical protein
MKNETQTELKTFGKQCAKFRGRETGSTVNIIILFHKIISIGKEQFIYKINSIGKTADFSKCRVFEPLHPKKWV